jgi:hypothetical protein
MKSSWDSTKGRTQYHYDTKLNDPRFDTVVKLGRIEPTWQHQLTDIIANSKPASWRTRGDPTKPSRPEEELSAEEYDLERAGYAKDTKVTNLNWAIPDNLQAIANAFAAKCSRWISLSPGVWRANRASRSGGAKEALTAPRSWVSPSGPSSASTASIPSRLVPDIMPM